MLLPLSPAARAPMRHCAITKLQPITYSNERPAAVPDSRRLACFASCSPVSLSSGRFVSSVVAPHQPLRVPVAWAVAECDPRSRELRLPSGLPLPPDLTYSNGNELLARRSEDQLAEGGRRASRASRSPTSLIMSPRHGQELKSCEDGTAESEWGCLRERRPCRHGVR